MFRSPFSPLSLPAAVTFDAFLSISPCVSFTRFPTQRSWHLHHSLTVTAFQGTSFAAQMCLSAWFFYPPPKKMTPPLVHLATSLYGATYTGCARISLTPTEFAVRSLKCQRLWRDQDQWGEEGEGLNTVFFVDMRDFGQDNIPTFHHYTSTKTDSDAPCTILLLPLCRKVGDKRESHRWLWRSHKHRPWMRTMTSTTSCRWRAVAPWTVAVSGRAPNDFLAQVQLK